MRAQSISDNQAWAEIGGIERVFCYKTLVLSVRLVELQRGEKDEQGGEVTRKN